MRPMPSKAWTFGHQDGEKLPAASCSVFCGQPYPDNPKPDVRTPASVLKWRDGRGQRLWGHPLTLRILFNLVMFNILSSAPLWACEPANLKVEGTPFAARPFQVEGKR